MNRIRLAKKLIAAALAAVTFSQSCLAEFSRSAFLPPTLPSAFPADLPLLHSALPSTLGHRRDLRLPSGAVRGLVVYVQDVHRNNEAQDNIRRAILALANAGVGTVALEGAEGPIDVGPLRRTVPLEDRAALARFLLRENKISGPAAAALTSESPLTILGVDDAGLHAANVKAYLDSRAARAAVASELSVRRARLELEKARLYSAPLRRFDALVEAHRAGRMSFGAYVRALADRGDASSEMSRFVQAFELESKLDFTAVERDRQRLLERLAARAAKDELSSLLSLGVALRTGRCDTAAFYEAVARLCEATRLPLTQFPAFLTYLRYTRLSATLQAEKLLADVAAAERTIFDRLARTPDEKRLVAQSRRLALTEKLVGQSLTREEWEEYQTFPATEVSGLAPFEDFYRRAEQRDERMAARTLAAVAAAPGRSVVLVTGGFHTAGLSRQLLASGVAVLGFTPRLTRVADGSAYLSAFAREKTPLENLFSGDRLFLAQNPLPADVRGGELPAGALGRATLQHRAPRSAQEFMASAAPQAGITSVRAGAHEDAALVHLERGARAVDVEERLLPDGEVASLTEREAPTDTYALGFRLLGRFNNWRRLTELTLAWLVELPAVVHASFSGSAFERLLARHWRDRRAELERLTRAVRAGTMIAAFSGAAAAVLVHPGAFEPLLVLSVLTMAATAGTFAALTIASAGHLGQNIFGNALTAGNPGSGAPRYLRNARVFNADGEGVSLPTHFELAPLPIAAETLDALGRRIVDIVARRVFENVTAQGRSLVLALPSGHEIVVGGQSFNRVVMKKTTYLGGLPTADAYTPGDDELMLQPTHFLHTSAEGRAFWVPAGTRATGTGPLQESLVEYAAMADAHAAGVPTPLPIGVGEFTTLSANGQPLGFLVYLDNAPLQRIGQIIRDRRRAAAEHGADVDTLMRGIFTDLAPDLRAVGRALRQLHDSGRVHRHPHLFQFSPADHGVSRMYDLDGSQRVGTLTRQEFAFWCLQDLMYVYSSIGNTVVGDPKLQRMIFGTMAPMLGLPDPFQALFDGYFHPEERDPFFPMHFAYTWPPLSERTMVPPTGMPLAGIDPEIMAYFNAIGGAAYDRQLNERVIEPLQRAGIPMNVLRPHLRALHETALRRRTLSARDVVRELRGVRLRRGWAAQIASAVAAFAEVPAERAKPPLLVLPLTEWLVGFVEALAQGSTGFVRWRVRSIFGEPQDPIHWRRGYRPAVVEDPPPHDLLWDLNEAFGEWAETASDAPEHRVARERLEGYLRLLQPDENSMATLSALATELLRKLKADPTLDVSETLGIVQVLISRLPFTDEGHLIRDHLFHELVFFGNGREPHVQALVFNTALLLAPFIRLEARSETFRTIVRAFGLRGEGGAAAAVSAGYLVQALLPRLIGPKAAVAMLVLLRADLTYWRTRLGGRAKGLFDQLVNVSLIGRDTAVDREQRRIQRREIAERVVGYAGLRTFVVPAVELWGLPGLGFAAFPLVALVSPTLAPWLAPAAAGFIFALLHGIPGHHQSWAAFGGRLVAAWAIQQVSLAIFLSIPSIAGIGGSLVAAYALHAAWNATVPEEWALALSPQFRRRLRETMAGLKIPSTSNSAVVALGTLMDKSRAPEQRAAIFEALAAYYRSGNDHERLVAPIVLTHFIDAYPKNAREVARARTLLAEGMENTEAVDDARIAAVEALTSAVLKAAPRGAAVEKAVRRLLAVRDQPISRPLLDAIQIALETLAKDVGNRSLRLAIGRSSVRYLGIAPFEKLDDHLTELRNVYSTFSRSVDRRALARELIDQLPAWEQAFARSPEILATIGWLLREWTELSGNKQDLSRQDLERWAEHVVRFYPRVGALYEDIAQKLVQLGALTREEVDRLEYAHWDLHPSHLERDTISFTAPDGLHATVIGRLHMRSQGLSVVQRPEWRIEFLSSEGDTYQDAPPRHYEDVGMSIQQDGHVLWYYPGRLVGDQRTIDVMVLLGEPMRPGSLGTADDVAVTDHGRVRRTWLPWRFGHIRLNDDDEDVSGNPVFRRPALPVTGTQQQDAVGGAVVVPLAVDRDGRRAYHLFTMTGVIFETELNQDQALRDERERDAYREELGGRPAVADLQERVLARQRLVTRLNEELDQMPTFDRDLLVIDFTEDMAHAIGSDLYQRSRSLFSEIFGEINPADLDGRIFSDRLRNFFSSRLALNGDISAALAHMIDDHMAGHYVPSLNREFSDDGMAWLVRRTAELTRDRSFPPLPAAVESAMADIARNPRLAAQDRHPAALQVVAWLSRPPVVTLHEIDRLERVLMSRTRQLAATIATFVRPEVGTDDQGRPTLDLEIDDSFDPLIHTFGGMFRLAQKLFSPRVRESLNPRPTYVEIQMPDVPGRRFFAGSAGRGRTVAEALDSLPFPVANKAAYEVVAVRPHEPDRPVNLADPIRSGDTLVVRRKPGASAPGTASGEPPSTLTPGNGGSSPATPPEPTWTPRTRDRRRGERRPPPDPLSEKRAASVVLGAVDALLEPHPDAPAFATRLIDLTRDAGLNLDVSAVEGRMTLVSTAGLLDETSLAADIQELATARGGRLALPQARRLLQRLLFDGAVGADLSGVLQETNAADHAADIAILPPSLSADQERRLVTILGKRAGRRHGDGFSALLVADETSAGRLRALGVAGVSIIVAPGVLGRDAAGATVELAQAIHAVEQRHVKLADFSTVSLITPAGHTILVDGLSPDLPWVRRAAILLIDDLLRTTAAPVPMLYRIERAARTVDSQA